MPEAATVVLQKKVSFKMSQSSQETPVPEEISANLAKFFRTFFLQKLQRTGCNALFLWLGMHLPIQLLWASARVLVTSIS